MIESPNPETPTDIPNAYTQPEEWEAKIDRVAKVGYGTIFVVSGGVFGMATGGATAELHAPYSGLEHQIHTTQSEIDTEQTALISLQHDAPDDSAAIADLQHTIPIHTGELHALQAQYDATPHQAHLAEGLALGGGGGALLGALAFTGAIAYIKHRRS